jgi:hypothetical protein
MKFKFNLVLCEEAEAATGGGALPADDSGLEDNSAVFEEIATMAFDEEDDFSEPVVEVPPVAEVPVVPAVAPVAPVVPAVAPVVSEVPAAVPPVPAQEVQPVAPAVSPAVVAPSQTREQTVSALEQAMPALTEDEIVALRNEPEKVLPKMLANMFYDMHGAIMQAVQASMPNMLQEVQTRASSVQAAEAEFHTAWPLLKDKGDLVLRIGRAYKAANPGADRATMIREIGAMAMVQAQIPFDVVTGKAITPAAPVGNQPFRPTVTSSASSAASQLSSDNPYEQMAELFLREDSE